MNFQDDVEIKARNSQSLSNEILPIKHFRTNYCILGWIQQDLKGEIIKVELRGIIRVVNTKSLIAHHFINDIGKDLKNVMIVGGVMRILQ